MPQTSIQQKLWSPKLTAMCVLVICEMHFSAVYISINPPACIIYKIIPHLLTGFRLLLVTIQECKCLMFLLYSVLPVPVFFVNLEIMRIGLLFANCDKSNICKTEQLYLCHLARVSWQNLQMHKICFNANSTRYLYFHGMFWNLAKNALILSF